MDILSLINLKGTYTSPPLTIPLIADGIVSKVSWEVDSPVGSTVIVQIRHSYNGYDWSEWNNCINDSQIPELNTDTPMNDTQFMFRVIMQSDSYETKPIFKSLTMDFEPVLIFDNKGDSYCYPEVWITKIGNGDISLINTSNKNEEFKFVELINNETVYINNENHHIESNLSTVYRYSNFNNKYLKLPIGKNVFKVQGYANIQFRYQFPLI